MLASPSIVTTLFPATCFTGIWQDLIGSPSNRTVHAPQWPVAAAVLAAGQPQVGSQDPQQHSLAIHIQTDGLVVELELNRLFHRFSPFVFVAADRSPRAGGRGGRNRGGNWPINAHAVIVIRDNPCDEIRRLQEATPVADLWRFLLGSAQIGDRSRLLQRKLSGPGPGGPCGNQGAMITLNSLECPAFHMLGGL